MNPAALIRFVAPLWPTLVTVQQHATRDTRHPVKPAVSLREMAFRLHGRRRTDPPLLDHARHPSVVQRALNHGGTAGEPEDLALYAAACALRSRLCSEAHVAVAHWTDGHRKRHGHVAALFREGGALFLVEACSLKPVLSWEQWPEALAGIWCRVTFAVSYRAHRAGDDTILLAPPVYA